VSAPHSSSVQQVPGDGPEIVVGRQEDLPEGIEDEGDAASPPMTRDELLTSGARSIAIGALVGLAIVAYFRFAYRSRWVDEFLQRNVLGEEPRKELLISLVAGAVFGGVFTAGALFFTHKKTGEVRSVERWAWFLSPLVLLPFTTLLFRYKPWLNRHDVLLSLLIPIILLLEALVVRCLDHAPRLVREWWDGLRTQLPAFVRKQGPTIMVVAGALTYAGFFTFYLLRWHYKLRTGNFDLSINNNLMFGGLHGEFLRSTVAFPTDPSKYLATHAKFGSFWFLPIYALVPRAETLLVIQATLIGLSAIPLFAFARRHLSEWLAAIVALTYLLYYPMHGASFSEFQNVPIAACFVFATVWAADARRFGWMALFAVVSLSMREDIPVGMAVVGAFLLVSGHRPMPGLILATVSTVYFLILRFYVMEEAGSWWFPNMYKELWADGEKGFKSVVKTLLTNPLFTLNKLIVEKKLVYLMHLLVPIAFLPVRRYYLWAAFIPGAVLTLLVTNYDPPITFSFHYVMHWAPYLFMASVVALKVIRDERGQNRMYAAAAAMVGATLVLTYNYGAFPARNGSFKGQFNKIEFTFTDAERARYKALQEIIQIIPPDASLAATEKVGPHVSSRLVIYTMRNGPYDAEWILASSRELKLSKTRPKLREAVESGRYGVVKRIEDFAVLRRGHDTSGNQKLIEDWDL
jgi:uncharacterized membrane protein